MPIAPVPLPPSMHLEQIDAGYKASLACRAVLDSLDLSMCLTQVAEQHHAYRDAAPSFSIGFSVGSFTLMDHLESAIERKGLTPSGDLQAKAAYDTTLVAAVGLEKQGRAAGLDDATITSVLQQEANTPADRWTYWRTRPLPDWLAKQVQP